MFDGRKGAGDEVIELPIGELQDDTGQVVGNEEDLNNSFFHIDFSNEIRV